MNRRLSASDFAKWTAQVPDEWNVDRLGNVAQILFSNVQVDSIYCLSGHGIWRADCLRSAERMELVPFSHSNDPLYSSYF